MVENKLLELRRLDIMHFLGIFRGKEGILEKTLEAFVKVRLGAQRSLENLLYPLVAALLEKRHDAAMLPRGSLT
jgi:hypothetical protein